jgi:hypothetical protein
MSPWKRARHQLRCYLAEVFLEWSLNLVPSGSNEEIAMCLAIQTYQRELASRT